MQPKILASALLATLLAAPVMAGTQVLLPAQSGDMVATTLRASSSTASITTARRTTLRTPALPAQYEQAPISVSWALDHDSELQALPQPFASDSREYWRDVSASELQQGLRLPLTAPGAVIRLSPGDAVGGKLNAADVHLQLGAQSLTANTASARIADAAEMREAGMDLPAATMVMQLKPELGTGMATLKVPTASGRYVVHVFEPQSPFMVTSKADRTDVLIGNAVQVRVGLKDADRSLPLNSVGGLLRAPDGSTTRLSFRRQADGSFTADVRPRNASSTPGLWEVHAFTQGLDEAGNVIRRDTTTAFAAAQPTARLSGLASTALAADQGIDITLGVTAQSTSRYAVSGVLYGRSANGVMVPAAFAQSASVMRPGEGQLKLHFDPTSLQGVSAPYELHDLRLQDQPAVGLLERRAVAMRFSTL